MHTFTHNVCLHTLYTHICTIDTILQHIETYCNSLANQVSPRLVPGRTPSSSPNRVRSRGPTWGRKPADGHSMPQLFPGKTGETLEKLELDLGMANHGINIVLTDLTHLSIAITSIVHIYFLLVLGHSWILYLDPCPCVIHCDIQC